MSLLRFPKTFEQTNKIKIGKSLKRVDSGCILLVFQTLPKFLKRKIANGADFNDLNLFSKIRGILKQGSRRFFIVSSSLYFSMKLICSGKYLFGSQK